VVVMTMLIPALSPPAWRCMVSGTRLLIAALVLIPVVWLRACHPRVLVLVARDGNDELLLLTTVTIGWRLLPSP